MKPEKDSRQAQWYTPIISALGRLRQEEFEACLSYVMTSRLVWALGQDCCLKGKKKEKRTAEF
jgi:hypothetical protein